MNWKILFVGLILTGIIGIAYAAPTESNTIKSLEISEMWTLATKNEGSEIGIFWKINNTLQNEQLYPIEIKYFYGNKEFYNRTITYANVSSWNSYGTFQYFNIEYGYPYKKIGIQLIDKNGNFLDSKSQDEPYVPNRKFDNQKDIQLVNINITKRKFGIFNFWNDYYNVYFTIKNINKTNAFKGRINFGDLGKSSEDWQLPNWKVCYNLTLEPSQSFIIERSGLTEKELESIKTELQTCMFY